MVADRIKSQKIKGCDTFDNWQLCVGNQVAHLATNHSPVSRPFRLRTPSPLFPSKHQADKWLQHGKVMWRKEKGDRGQFNYDDKGMSYNYRRVRFKVRFKERVKRKNRMYPEMCPSI